MILVTWEGTSVNDCVTVLPVEGLSVSDLLYWLWKVSVSVTVSVTVSLYCILKVTMSVTVSLYCYSVNNCDLFKPFAVGLHNSVHVIYKLFAVMHKKQ